MRVYYENVGGRPVVHVEMNHEELRRLLKLPVAVPGVIIVTARRDEDGKEETCNT